MLVVAGPGNNGGDGLVAARHLHHLGYLPRVVYPKPNSGALFRGLVKQLAALDVAVAPAMPTRDEPASFGLIVDAVFGFSFAAGGIREPFRSVLAQLKELSSQQPAHRERPRLVSIDIPSGWDVEMGDTSEGGAGLAPDLLVSLTAPKPCSRFFRGQRHMLGGRFLPPRLALKYGLQELPRCEGARHSVELPPLPPPLGAS